MRDRLTYRPSREVDRQIDRQSDILTHKQAYTETDRQTATLTHRGSTDSLQSGTDSCR